jgi:hypothetical protein
VVRGTDHRTTDLVRREATWRSVMTADPPLPTLFSQMLLAFTLDFERESPASLPVGANTLRILTEKGFGCASSRP